MRWVITVLVFTWFFGLIGCKHAPEKTSTVDPDRVYFEKVRAGAFQLSNAMASLADANDQCEAALKAAPKTGELHDALTDAHDFLDSSGESIGDYSGEPPAFGTYKAEMDKHKSDLTDSLQGSNDAYKDISEASGIIDDLIETAPAKMKPLLEKLAESLGDAQDAIEAAIEAFGGTIPDQGDDSGGGDGGSETT